MSSLNRISQRRMGVRRPFLLVFQGCYGIRAEGAWHREHLKDECGVRVGGTSGMTEQIPAHQFCTSAVTAPVCEAGGWPTCEFWGTHGLWIALVPAVQKDPAYSFMCQFQTDR